MSDVGVSSLVRTPGAPVSIVRDATAMVWRDSKPTIALSAGVAVGAVLIVAAIVVRRRGRAPRAVPVARTRSVVLAPIAKELKIGRVERLGIEHLAAAAGVGEPAVLLLSEHAFQSAAAQVIGETPDAREGIGALARRLGFDLEGDPGVRGRTVEPGA